MEEPCPPKKNGNIGFTFSLYFLVTSEILIAKQPWHELNTIEVKIARES